MSKIIYLLLGVLISLNLFSQKIDAPFELTLDEITFPDKTFNIIDYGAKEGGEVKCTKAIADAIEAATNTGGGYVFFPKGKYLTGPIVLKDNVCLKFEDGTIVYFSTDHEDYLPAVLSRHGGIDVYKHSSFIYANNATNIGLIGKVILEGQGEYWMALRNRIGKRIETMGTRVHEQYMGNNNVPLEERVFDDTTLQFLDPCFIMPIYCKNILIDGITCRFGAFWTVNPVYCDSIIIRNVTVITIDDERRTRNGDGINLSSCRNVLVEDCTLDTGDDCISLKSGRGIDGYKRGIPTQNVVIRNCVGMRGHGGIVIGSETSGGIRNIYAHDCEFNGTKRGIRIKTARGRGDAIENIWFENIKMTDMIQQSIRIIMPRYTSRYPAHEITRLTPRIRNIHFKNIECNNTLHGEAILINGLPEMPVENLTFENIVIHSKKRMEINDASMVAMKNVNITTKEDTALIIDNGSNFYMEDLKLENKKIQIRGEKAGEINFINSTIKKENISYINCDNKVRFLNEEKN